MGRNKKKEKDEENALNPPIPAADRSIIRNATTQKKQEPESRRRFVRSEISFPAQQATKNETTIAAPTHLLLAKVIGFFFLFSFVSSIKFEA